MRRTVTVTLGVGAAVLLAGCGGGGGGEDVKPIPPTRVTADKPVSVRADEYSFNPESILVADPGAAPAEITVELRNDGAQAHDLRLRRGGEDVGGTPIFGPNETKTAKVSLDPGSYEMFCSVGNHEDLGMKGTLVVE
jgi:plastocyanin